MFITGPDVIKTVTHEEVTKEELGGAMTHNAELGRRALRGRRRRATASLLIRELLSFLPSNNLEDPPLRDDRRSVDRADPALDSLVPAEPEQALRHQASVDHARSSTTAASSRCTSTSRRTSSSASRASAGAAVGIVANQPAVLAGVPRHRRLGQGRALRALLRRFNIPLVTFEDVPGFLPGTDQEYGGIIRHGAKLLYAFAEATVPKLTVITRKAYGGAYYVMASKHIRADLNFA